MRDLALRATGLLAILVAVAHGTIAELRVFRKAHAEPGEARTLLMMVRQASAIDWICFGVLLIAVPALGSESARGWIVAVAALAHGYAAVGSAVVHQGRRRIGRRGSG
jgi:hypothetical protein